MSANSTKQSPIMSFAIRRDQMDALDRLAAEHDRNRSYIVRKAIDLYLAVNAQSSDIIPARESDQDVAA